MYNKDFRDGNFNYASRSYNFYRILDNFVGDVLSVHLDGRLLFPQQGIICVEPIQSLLEGSFGVFLDVDERVQIGARKCVRRRPHRPQLAFLLRVGVTHVHNRGSVHVDANFSLRHVKHDFLELRIVREEGLAALVVVFQSYLVDGQVAEALHVEQGKFPPVVGGRHQLHTVVTGVGGRELLGHRQKLLYTFNSTMMTRGHSPKDIMKDI